MVFYALFGFLDYCLYSVVSIILRLIIIVAHYNFFSEGVIADFAGKVYVVLGVLMLFRLVISAVQYLINPDEMDDKNKGLFGVLQRLIICVAVLVLIDPVYKYALEVQGTIVKTIPKVILGNSASGGDYGVGEIGQEMAYDTLSAFFEPKKDKTITTQNQITNLEEFKNHIYWDCNKGLAGFDVFTTENCVYDYRIIISTAVGAFLVYVLLSMALDIGIRTIKLGLIRILAPIPVGSYINNKDSLSKFGKMALNVYLDLFIRMGIVYFIIFAIKAILDSFGAGVSYTGLEFTPTSTENVLVMIVIIIALLMFAKNAPKFICDLLGIDGGGFGDMKEMFQPFWKRAGGLAAVGGMATAGFANIANKVAQAPGQTFGQKLKNALKNPATWKSGVAGAASAGLHGLVAAAQGKNASEVMKAGHARAVKARQNREIDAANGVKWYNRVGARFNDYMGIDTDASLAKGQLEGLGKVRQNTVELQGNYNKAIEKYASSINVMESAAFKTQLQNLFDSSRNSINNGQSQYLKDMLAKFDRGDAISYAEVLAMRNAAATPNSGGELIAQELTKGMGTMKAMEKALWLDSMDGKIKNMSGQSHTYLDPKSADFDTDVAGSIAKMRQDIRQNLLSISGENMVYGVDSNGNKLRIDKAHAHDPDLLEAAFKYNFKQFDDALAKQQQEIQGQVNTTAQAAARASIERRNANKKENK